MFVLFITVRLALIGLADDAFSKLVFASITSKLFTKDLWLICFYFYPYIRLNLFVSSLNMYFSACSL